MGVVDVVIGVVDVGVNGFALGESGGVGELYVGVLGVGVNVFAWGES